MAVEQAVLPVETMIPVAITGIPFAMDTVSFLEYVHASGRDHGPVTPSTLKYNSAIYDRSVFDCREGVKTDPLSAEGFLGLMSLRRWVGNGHESRFLKRVADPNKLEYLVTMARRDILTNTTGQIMAYGMSFIQMHEGSLEDSYATITSSPRDPFVTEMSAQARPWGFSDAYDLLRFTAAFDALENSYFFGELEPRVRKSMPHNACEAQNLRMEEFNRLEARKAVFTYFYLNQLFPEHNEARQTTLHRLGLPEFIRPVQIEETRCHDRIHGKDIGSFLAFMNSPYIRFGFNAQLLRKV